MSVDRLEPSWSQGLADSGALSSTQSNQPLAPAAAGASRLSFGVSLFWLVMNMSNILSYLGEVSPFNLFYPFCTVFVGYLIVVRMSDVLRLMRRFEFWFWLFTAVFPIALYVGSSHDPLAWVDLRWRIVFFSTVAGTAAILLGPDRRRLLRIAGFIALLIAIPVNFVELFIPNILSTAAGRSAGFYENPNDASAALIVCLLFAVNLRRPNARDVLLMSAGFAAIVTTFSRMGLVFAIPLWAAYTLIPQRQGIRSGQRLVLLGALAVCFVGASVYVVRTVQLDPAALLRIRSILTGDISDESATVRGQLVQEAWTAFLANFWSGQGLGAVERRFLLPHNSFLYLALDFGILGLIFYCVALFAALARSVPFGWTRGANAIVLSLLLIWCSFFTHYVHMTTFFGVAFGALAAEALIELDPSRREDSGKGFVRSDRRSFDDDEVPAVESLARSVDSGP